MNEWINLNSYISLLGVLRLIWLLPQYSIHFLVSSDFPLLEPWFKLHRSLLTMLCLTQSKPNGVFPDINTVQINGQ